MVNRVHIRDGRNERSLKLVGWIQEARNCIVSGFFREKGALSFTFSFDLSFGPVFFDFRNMSLSIGAFVLGGLTWSSTNCETDTLLEFLCNHTLLEVLACFPLIFLDSGHFVVIISTTTPRFQNRDRIQFG